MPVLQVDGTTQTATWSTSVNGGSYTVYYAEFYLPNGGNSFYCDGYGTISYQTVSSGGSGTNGTFNVDYQQTATVNLGFRPTRLCFFGFTSYPVFTALIHNESYHAANKSTFIHSAYTGGNYQEITNDGTRFYTSWGVNQFGFKLTSTGFEFYNGYTTYSPFYYFASKN